MDLLSGGISDITGKIAKATIRIKDKRSVKDDFLERKPAITNASGKLGAAGAMAANAKDKAQELKNLADKAGIYSGIVSRLGIKTNEMLRKYDKVFEVQFNPSSFSIYGSGGGLTQVTDVGMGGGINYARLATNMQLSVKLLFDKTSTTGSFPMSVMTKNVATMAGDVINTGKDLIFGQIHVETVVEGFCAAVRNNLTQQVCFQWGNMYYEGLCKSANATYTLFDASGQPTRATVDFSIYLYDQEVKRLGDSYEMGYWMNAYKKVFSSDSTFGSWGQKVAGKVLGN